MDDAAVYRNSGIKQERVMEQVGGFVGLLVGWAGQPAWCKTKGYRYADGQLLKRQVWQKGL